MSDAISALSSALNNDMEEMRSISQNIANLNTAGYKRQITAVSSFQQALSSPVAGALPDTALGQSAGSLPRIDIYRDLTQGALKYSGNAFDIALAGEGFLQVKLDQGIAYTRKGSLKIDEQGRLSLVNGEPVTGQGGDIYLQNSPFTIDRDGVITQNQEQVDKLRVVEFENPQQLNYLGGGLFGVAAGSALVAIDGAGEVMQGYQEASNVKSADEMVKMIEISRHFETSHQILRGYDSMLDNAINVLGDL